MDLTLLTILASAVLLIAVSSAQSSAPAPVIVRTEARRSRLN